MSWRPNLQCPAHPEADLSSELLAEGHRTGQHGEMTSSEFYAMLREKSQDTPDVPQPKTASGDQFFELGLDVDDLSSLTINDVACANLPSTTDIGLWLAALGKEQGLNINKTKFFVDFLRYVLITAASEDTASAGGLTLRDKATATLEKFVTWDEVKQHGLRFFAPKGIPFTLRKLMRATNESLYRLYIARPKALADILSNGTPLSQRWIFNGMQVAPYVPVPDLFAGHWTPADIGHKQLIALRVRKLGSDLNGLQYTGLDVEGKGMAAEADFAEDQSRSRAAQSAVPAWLDSTAPGVRKAIARAGLGYGK